MLEPLVILLSVLVFTAAWGFWFLVMRFCLRTWINKWAESLDLRLIAQKVHFIRRGPFRLALPFLPIYRVKCLDESGETMSGWVQLGAKFFLGGKGAVIWDESD